MKINVRGGCYMYVTKNIIPSIFFILISGFSLLTPAETSYAQPSDCCIAHDGAGCDDLTCEETVCGNNFFCCDGFWATACADQANSVCAVCQAQPNEGCCTGLGEFPDACSILTEQECTNSGGTYQGDGTNCNSFNQCFTRPIPTMSEWGLIAMAGILGFVGFMVMRRRKVTA